ncbi:MAG TPA: glycosyltransferase family 2 protein [Miltoncostaea sp.]|nr:glycosyltransferase family 2 protein [Miltoncostaea sp.]
MPASVRGAVELARVAAAGARLARRRRRARRAARTGDGAGRREIDLAFAELGATLAQRSAPAHAPVPGERLGDALVRRGLVSPADLERALAAHRASGERLGRVLLSMGFVRRQELHRVLGELWGIPFCDLTRIDLDEHLVRRMDPAAMAAEGWVPVDRRGDVVWVATAEPPDDRVAGALSAELGADVEVQFLATTEWDVNAVLRGVFADRLADEAANGLFERNPLASARHGLTRGQRFALIAAAAAAAGAFTWNPVTAGIILCSLANIGFLTAVAFKLVTALAGWRSVRRGVVAAGARIPDDELPFYTVLVPVFHEANIVSGLVGHLRELDYPQEKLEILLLMEEEDTETLEAARAAQPPDIVKFVVVPKGRPQTKPRACNMGLVFSHGEFLVIYDAEDRPEPGQLREAVAAFRAGGEELVCVQARLNYFNARENVLTRMFTLEYSWWFDYMLPGLDALRLPIPLGGTSNHFRTAVLRRLGGWDAWNVTEDADLGLRAAAEGYTVGVIPSTTYEEACGRYWPWIRQRTRWIKGYMQTALVHTRRPVETARAAGVRGVVGLLLLVLGTPVIFLLAPIMWLITLVWLTHFAGAPEIPDLLPGPMEAVGAINLIVGNAMMVTLNALAVGRRRIHHLLPYALLNPLYWCLHYVAAWRALYQLVRNPFHWEKTPHGLTSQRAVLAVGGSAEHVALGGGGAP